MKSLEFFHQQYGAAASKLAKNAPGELQMSIIDLVQLGANPYRPASTDQVLGPYTDFELAGCRMLLALLRDESFSGPEIWALADKMYSEPYEWERALDLPPETRIDGWALRIIYCFQKGTGDSLAQGIALARKMSEDHNWPIDSVLPVLIKRSQVTS